MIDGTYSISLDTPLGSKSGMVNLTTSGNQVVAQIDAPLIGKQKIVGTLKGTDGFTASGSMRMGLLGKLDYTAEGHVEGDTITCDISSKKGTITVSGKRQ